MISYWTDQAATLQDQCISLQFVQDEERRKEMTETFVQNMQRGRTVFRYVASVVIKLAAFGINSNSRGNVVGGDEPRET